MKQQVDLAVVYIWIESVFTDRDTRTQAQIVQHLVNVNRRTALQ